MSILTVPRTRLSIVIGEDDSWHHKPLYHEIVRRAREAGLAGATVLRGCEGFGASSMVHTTRLLAMSEDLPVVIVIVDTEQRIREFLAETHELVADGMITLDTVEMVVPAREAGS